MVGWDYTGLEGKDAEIRDRWHLHNHEAMFDGAFGAVWWIHDFSVWEA